MKTIMIWSQKGGVGKTVIADELAYSLERSGIRLDFYEMDQQAQCRHSGVFCDDPEVAVVDTPGVMKDQQTKWISNSDYVIIPTVPGGEEEKEPLINSLSACYAQGKPVMLVVNRVRKNTSSLKDLLNGLDELPVRPPMVMIPQSEDISGASRAEMSTLAYKKHGKAARELKEAINKIREFAGLGREE